MLGEGKDKTCMLSEACGLKIGLRLHLFYTVCMTEEVSGLARLSKYPVSSETSLLANTKISNTDQRSQLKQKF